MKRLSPVIFCLAGLFFLAGCSSKDLPGLTGLGVTLIGIERSADGATQVHWQLNNPNVVAYLIQASSHKIYLDGRLVGTAATREPVGLNRQSTQNQSAIMQLDKGSEAALAAALARGTSTYRLESNLTITTYGDYREEYRTNASGTVSLTGK
jgi:hypothetical protein